jgi:hypothetical protein
MSEQASFRNPIASRSTVMRETKRDRISGFWRFTISNSDIVADKNMVDRNFNYCCQQAIARSPSNATKTLYN